MNVIKLCSGSAGNGISGSVQYVYVRDKAYIIILNSKRCFVCDHAGNVIVDKSIDLGFLASQVRLWKVFEQSNSLILRIVGNKSGSLEIVDVLIDISTGNVSYSQVKSISLSWISTWEEIAHSQIIGDVLFSCDWDGDYHIHAVNLITGEDVDLGTFGLSNPIRVSSKVFLRASTSLQLLMIISEMLAGSDFYVVDLISGSQVKTINGTGGASPRPNIGAISVFKDKLYIPLANSGVNDTSNTLDLYDESFSKIASIDFSGYIDNPNPWGFSLIAKLSDGKFIFIGNIVNNSTNNIDNYVVGKLNPDFTIYDLQVIRSVDRTPYGGHGEGTSNSLGSYDDKSMIPIIDPKKKIAFFVIEDADPNGAGFYPTVYKIDFTDEDVVEFNAHSFIVSSKIPTSLSLLLKPY